MLNRRHIRIKVMQSVYALLQSKSDDLKREEKFLFFSIDKLYNLYVLQLSLLVEVQKFVKKRLAITNKNRVVSSVENKQAIENLSQNKFIQIIANSVSLSEVIANKKIDNWKEATEYLQVIYDKIKTSAILKEYDKNKNPSFKEDKQFAIAIFKEIIAPNDKLLDYYEDQYIGWVDDVPFVNTSVLKTYSKLTDKLVLDNLYKDEDDRAFVKELFEKVVLHHTEYDEEIDKKTPNWDYDRIAEIDLILIKMAMSEFLYFPSIPTKVTINEYLEIAKDYSSDKSSFFINGVLDKIEKEYQKSGKISKIGRGLL